MRIGIISDTHNRIESWVINSFNDVDLVIHCGDVENLDTYEELKIISKGKLIAVKGNLDYNLNLPNYYEFKLSDKCSIIIAHKPEDAYKFCTPTTKIMVFGHTHNLEFKYENGIYIINPGSASIPKNKNQKSVVKFEYTDNLQNVEFIFSK